MTFLTTVDASSYNTKYTPYFGYTVTATSNVGSGRPFYNSERDFHLYNCFDTLNRLIDGFSKLNLSEEIEELPSNVAIQNAKLVLETFQSFSKIPEKISPTAEGGIMYEYHIADTSYIIEFYNSGEIVYLKKIENRNPIAMDISMNELAIRLLTDIRMYGD